MGLEVKNTEEEMLLSQLSTVNHAGSLSPASTWGRRGQLAGWGGKAADQLGGAQGSGDREQRVRSLSSSVKTRERQRSNMKACE